MASTLTQGIDVSFYQLRIDWASVRKAQQAQFAFIKASQNDYRDPQFTVNWPNARIAGMPRGAYHYLQANTQHNVQPQTFLNALDGDWGELPPVVDVEDKRAIDPQAYALLLSDWLETVREATGRRPIIYTAAWFCIGERARWINAVKGDSPLWVASYPWRNSPAPMWLLRWWKPRMPEIWRDWTVWQYSDRGRVSGIKTNVDLNVSRLSVEELKAL